MKNYYPPGVSGNEPEIVGYDDDENVALVIVKGGNAYTVAGDAEVYIWDWDNWGDDAGVGRGQMLRELAAFPRHLRVVIERDLDTPSRNRLRKLLSEASA